MEEIDEKLKEYKLKYPQFPPIWEDEGASRTSRLFRSFE